MSNVDINVDRRTDRRTDWRTDGRKIGRLYRTMLQAGAIKTYLQLSKLVNSGTDESDPHQVLNIKGKVRQIQLNSHKKNRWQAELATLSQKGGNTVTQT